MKVAMIADLEILKNAGDGQFVRMVDNEIIDVSIGGYMFDIEGYKVPFDWEAHESGWNQDGTFGLTTGRGWMFHNFELDSCYDECYQEMGLDKERISAEFLASVHHIDDFYINFVNKDGKECEVGSWKANSDPEAPYRLRLLKVLFEDVEAGRVYSVHSSVLSAFNKGERIKGLDSILRSAECRVEEDKTIDKNQGYSNIRI